MELNNEFTVAAPIERAWEVLNDVPTIAPCLPGATLEASDGDEHRGNVKVKVGPMSVQYRGVATFVERDESARRVVLRGEGRDARGQGTAAAVITAQLASDGDEATRVTVTTDLTVTGRVAQFGRGVMADVSAKLMAQFADRLADVVAAGQGLEPGESVDGGNPGDAAEGDGPPTDVAEVATDPDAIGVTALVREARVAAALPEPEPIDLLGTAGAPIAKRLMGALGVAAVIALIVRLVWPRRGR